MTNIRHNNIKPYIFLGDGRKGFRTSFKKAFVVFKAMRFTVKIACDIIALTLELQIFLYLQSTYGCI